MTKKVKSEYLGQYMVRYNPLGYSEYTTICARIEEAIRMDQIEGGMTGQYNASITQRLNNLTERVDTTTKGEKIDSIKVTIVRPDAD
jgi:hypothetical protein